MLMLTLSLQGLLFLEMGLHIPHVSENLAFTTVPRYFLLRAYTSHMFHKENLNLLVVKEMQTKNKYDLLCDTVCVCVLS